MFTVNVNENKSIHVTTYPAIYLNGIQIPQTVKYLGMHLDKQLNWK